MTTERVDIVVREDGSRVVKRNLEDIGKGSDKAANSLNMLKGILLGVFSAATIAGAVRMADEYTNIQNKLRLVTTGTQNLSRVTKELLTISNQTRSDFSATAELYARMANASKDMGLSQKELLGFTKTLNQAIVLSGASAEEAAGGLRQLAQGMASGTLRGDELNSVMENFPKVADIIAEGLGVTRGQLRAMGAEGKITADIIIDAFKKAEKTVGEDFAKTVPTVSQSLVVLKNNVMSWIGQADQALGVTSSLAKIMLTVANNIDLIGPALLGVGAAVAAAFVPTLVSAFAAQIRALWILVAANPFAALAAVVVGVSVALYAMRDAIKLGIDDTTTLGDLMRSVWEDVGGFIASVAGFAMDTWGMANDDMAASSKDSTEKQEAWWLKLLKVAANVFDAIGWLVRGTFAGIAAVATKVISNIADNLAALGRAMSAGMKGDFGEMAKQLLSGKSAFEGVGDAWGKAFSDAAQEQINGGLVAWLDDRIARAQEIGKARSTGEGDPLAPGGKPRTVKPPVDADAAKKAARELEQLRSALRGVLDEANPVEAAHRRLADVQDVLNKSVKAGLISLDDARIAYDQIADSMEDQLNPMGAINKQIDESIKLLKMSNQERQIEGQMLDYTRQLKDASLVVGEAELEQLRAKLTEEQKLARIAAVRDQLEGETIAAQQQGIQDLITAYGQLKETTSTDDFNFLNRLLGGSLEETQAAFDAQLAQFQTYYAAIEQFRQQDVKNEEIASAAKRAIKQQEMDLYLQRTSDALGAASGLMKSNSKEAFRIGQAAAIGQAIVNTYTAATAAYQSAAAIPYVGWILGPVAAAGAIAAGMAQVSAIRSQQMPAYRTGGSYTIGGSGGTDSQVVSLRGTPGEQISINTPSQANAMDRIAASLERGDRRRGDVHLGGITIVQQGKPDNYTTTQQAREMKKRAREMVPY